MHLFSSRCIKIPLLYYFPEEKQANFIALLIHPEYSEKKNQDAFKNVNLFALFFLLIFLNAHKTLNFYIVAITMNSALNEAHNNPDLKRKFQCSFILNNLAILRKQ